MSRHLPLLQQQFPEKILLSVDDIAKYLKWSKGHIYNLSNKKELPFPLIDGKGGVQVSIVAMADYLDGTLEPKVEPLNQSMSVPAMARARRRGRPRGSVSKRQMAFQSALSMAIIETEVDSIFEEIFDSVEAVAVLDGSEDCSEKFDISKRKIELLLTAAKSSLFASILNLRLPQASRAESKSRAFKI